MIAVIPVFVCLYIYGSSTQKVEEMLIFTQVFLSVALPLSIIPLILATNDEQIMGNDFINTRRTNIIAWITTVVLCILNIYLILQTFLELFEV
ncbi:divalent metal cation transporter [Macrococcus sp. EM39E]|uniref:divalent metal cation transporter n=1 Tax=Macrococcus animalis TaxID=3395467 RepID=UPI0039BDE156